MRRLLVALPLLAVVACSGDDGSAATSATTTMTTTSSTMTTSTTTGSTGSSAGATTTTGGELCYFGTTGDSGGAEGPWIELLHGGAPLVEGGVLGLECGFQGSYMFEVVPVLGGFVPVGDFVHFEVILDIDDHNFGPGGHFYVNGEYDILVGCLEDPNYEDPSYFPTTFQIQVHDEIAEILALDGLPAQLHLGFLGDGVSVAVDLNLTIDAAPDEAWMFCGFDGTTDGDTSGTTGDTTGDTSGTGSTGP